MKTRSSLMLLFALLFLPIFMCGTSEALTLKKSIDIPWTAPNSDVPFTLFSIDAVMNVEGCPITPYSPGFGWISYYVPYSCKTLSGTTTFSMTDMDPRITSIKTKIQIWTTQWNTDGRYLYSIRVGDPADWADGMPAPVLNTVTAPTPPQYIREGERALRSIVNLQIGGTFVWKDQYNEEHTTILEDQGGNFGVSIDFDSFYQDLASSDSPLLKGGANDNPNTHFEG
jgi:hypothetical protein